ncbi:hypothetical protein HHK36_003651 [Tetracentron sinense]|uniref:Nuclease HARBI1 n=1 Tax=Tetracentron sinense TaxID=13715 RepID=A0A834ZYV9_TETSI|nr:hypothetical protein HHK36_003651 [Tetracentron sinense]
MIESSSSTSSSTPQTSTDESSSDKDQETVSQHHNKRLQKMMNLMLPQMLAVLLQPVGRRYIKCDREGSYRQIWKDYCAENCTYPANYFHRRYRMRRELFLRILKDIEAYDEYIVQRKDCCGRLGCSSIQKITVAVHILAYGLSVDHCDEYQKIGESTVIESLKHFCEAVIALYDGQYLRSPNEQDIACLLQEGEERGFVGMLGSLDCMHWEWKNCPTAWHGTHRSHHHKPTLILEAVASKDLWIWHAFFQMSSSHNDVNVLDHSPLLNSLIHGRMPPVNYTMNGRQHTLGYYLSDGIYPQWATMMQTITHPTTRKERLFAKKQEAVRKDVERAFGILQIRWGITQGTVRYWKKDDICNVMKTCIILHNMINEDEHDIDVERRRPPPDETISPLEYTRNPAILVAHISSRLSKIHNI